MKSVLSVLREMYINKKVFYILILLFFLVGKMYSEEKIDINGTLILSYPGEPMDIQDIMTMDYNGVVYEASSVDFNTSVKNLFQLEMMYITWFHNGIFSIGNIKSEGLRELNGIYTYVVEVELGFGLIIKIRYIYLNKIMYVVSAYARSEQLLERSDVERYFSEIGTKEKYSFSKNQLNEVPTNYIELLVIIIGILLVFLILYLSKRRRAS